MKPFSRPFLYFCNEVQDPLAGTSPQSENGGLNTYFPSRVGVCSSPCVRRLSALSHLFDFTTGFVSTTPGGMIEDFGFSQKRNAKWLAWTAVSRNQQAQCSNTDGRRRRPWSAAQGGRRFQGGGGHNIRRGVSITGMIKCAQEIANP